MMASLSKDINSAGSDTRPPMLDSPERDRIFNDLTPEEKDRYKADVRATNIGNNAKGAAAAGNGGVQNIVGNANPGQAKPIQCSNYNGIGHEARQCTQPKRPQNSDYFKDKMLLIQAQENGVVLDEEQLLFIAGGQDNTFDDDVDEPPTMFLANLSSADPIYDDVCPSYDLDILSEVQDHDNYLDSVGEYHKVHEMQNDVQQNYVVDSDAEYMSDSNIIPYEQYVAQCIFANEQNKVVNESLTAELARYKKQVKIYEKRARFELTEREQNIDEQLRIIIIDHNIQEESLKKELHSVKMQLNSTIDHNKLMKEEVATLKMDFKQKESKYHEDFLDMKELKEKVEDKLFKQDQSLQTIHIAMQVQSALYNGQEIVKTNHAPAVMHDSKDTLELVEINRKRMLEKMKSPIRGKGFPLKHKIKKDDHSEIIPFFKTVKEYFEGIQTALIKEVKEIFEQMEAEVDQIAVDKKCAKIERKNLLTENGNLIADCLSNELLYSVMNVVNTVSRFSKMHDAYTITRANTIEKTSSLLTKNEKLKAQLKGKMKCVTMNTVKPKILAPGMYAIDVEPIPPHNRNNREAHLNYLKHLKERVETLHEIVEEDRIEKPLDIMLEYAYFYTKRSQELLEYVIGTCPKEFSKRDKKVATTPLNRNKQVTFRETCGTSNNNTQSHVEQPKVKKTNVHVIPSTGVNSSTKASGSKPRSNTKNNKILPAKSDNNKKIEDRPRNNKSNLKQENRVDYSISHKHTVWKATRKRFANVGYQWKPTGNKFTLGEQYPLTRITKSKVVPLQQPEHVSSSKIVITERFTNTAQKPLTRYKRRNKKEKTISTGIPTTAETQTIDA
ncbi:hypothetical protein Tco_0969026 [Tanacetum coccineum]